MPATIPADSDLNTFAHGLVRRFAERASGRGARLRAGDASIPARRVRRDQALVLADRAEAGVAGAAPVTESAAAGKRILILGGWFAGACPHAALRQRLSGREDVRRVETVSLGPAGSR